MAPCIHLVRHGRSAHVHDGRWMHADGVRHYETAYNLAGIRDDDAPPLELMALADQAKVVAASDLPRAIASARRIAPDRDLAISPLLREIELEPQRWIPVRLPIEVWDAFSHLQWSYRLLRGTDHEFVRRASEAAGWLVEKAAAGATVVAVTHGGFRRIVAADWPRAVGAQRLGGAAMPTGAPGHGRALHELRESPAILFRYGGGMNAEPPPSCS